MLLLALLIALVAPAHAAGEWRWPLRGEVVTPFRLGANPFAPGGHRGIDIAAAAGALVRSACPGRVRFAGRVPGRARVVSVDCGAHVASYLELGSVAVRRGAHVAAGSRIGTVAASHLQLGARLQGDRRAYVDPLRLLTTRRPPPLGAAPRGGGKRPRPAPVGIARPAAAPSGAPAAAHPGPAPANVPPATWLGLVLFAAGAPLGALLRRRRRAQALTVRTADERA